MRLEAGHIAPGQGMVGQLCQTLMQSLLEASKRIAADQSLVELGRGSGMMGLAQEATWGGQMMNDLTILLSA